jgi:hypothetical protein
MPVSEALAIIKAYGEAHGIVGTLETLMHMQEEDDAEALRGHDRMAFRVAMHGFRRLLEPA